MKNKCLMAVVAIVIVLALDIVIMILMNPEPRLPWTGEWDAAWGYHDESITDLDTLLNMIEDDEGNVTGTYSYNSIEGTIEGVADGGKLHGTWAQGHLSGSFEFTMSRDSQSFTGVWYQSDEEDGYWNGNLYFEQAGTAY